MTKIFAFTRESPYTVNDGSSQEHQIKLAYIYLTQMNALLTIGGDILCIDAHDSSRYSPFVCKHTQNLFSKIKDVNEAENVFVFVTSLD